MGNIIFKNSGISLKYDVDNEKIHRLENELKYLEKNSSNDVIKKISANSLNGMNSISSDINQCGFITIPFNDDERDIAKRYIKNILSFKEVEHNDMICTQVSQSFDPNSTSDNDILSYDTYFPYLYTQIFSFVDRYLNDSFYDIHESFRKLILGIIFDISKLDDDRYVFSPNLYILHDSGVNINIRDFETRLYGSIIPCKDVFKLMSEVYTIDDLKKIYNILDKDIEYEPNSLDNE